MTSEEKVKLISEVGEEIVGADELKVLIDSGKPLIAYDGFEPSGKLHIAQGLLRTININKMIKAGALFKMFVADWHALANNKMGGDLSRIQLVGRYFIEVWKACGLDLRYVEFVWASELVKTDGYWLTVIKIAKENSVNRIIRCSEIMGRSETETLSAAQILYPCMQTADIYFLGANITQLGMDQRKVSMLAREVGEKIGFWKPVVVSHHMLMGLGKPETDITNPLERTIKLKMSKSLPDTSIFMTDAPADIERKINKAYCPPGEIKDNPILEYFRYIIFEREELRENGQLTIKRSQNHGGNLDFNNYRELEDLYAKGDLHPADLKSAAVTYIDQLLAPVRKHFEDDPAAKNLKESVESFTVTR